MMLNKTEMIRTMAVLHAQLWQIPDKAVNNADMMRIIYGKLSNFTFGMMVAMALIGEKTPAEVQAMIDELAIPPALEDPPEEKGTKDESPKKTKESKKTS